MTEELLSNQAAIELLTELVPGRTAQQWAVALQNNRNPSRKVPHRIPYVRMSGSVFYKRDDIASFAEFEKVRQLGSIKLSPRIAEALRAYGVGDPGGSTTGRSLNVSAVNLQVDQSTAKPFIQVIATDPLMVYRIEVPDAKALAQELAQAVDAAERIA